VDLRGFSLPGKVARRLWLFYVVCAFLPIVVVASYSFHQVTEQLTAQSQRRLHQAAKSVAMSIFERLLLAELAMRTLAAGQAAEATVGRTSPALVATLEDRFMGVAVVGADRQQRDIVGSLEGLPDLPGRLDEHVAAGNPVLSTQLQPPLPPRVFMQLAVDPGRPEAGVLVGELATAYLWGIGDKNTMPPMTDLCVVDQGATTLICSLPGEVSFPEPAIREMTDDDQGRFEWRHAGEDYLASFWSMRLKYHFSAPKWTVILVEARESVLAPVGQFKRTSLIVIALSFVILLLLGVQTRQSLRPLGLIKQGTRRIAAGDFASRIPVRGDDDEFDELADSFNRMATRLERQFHTLATISEIDRAILSTLEADSIARALLARIRDLFPADTVRVTLLNPGESLGGQTYASDGEPPGVIQVHEIELTPEERQALRSNPDQLVIRVGEGSPSYLAAAPGAGTFLVAPIFTTDGLAGALALGSTGRLEPSDEDRARVRQLADQMAVALSNAHEVAERKRAEQSLQESNLRLEDALADVRATQAQVLQQERLRALGQMASGIAHDFNNALSPIVGYSEMLLNRPEYLADKTRVARYVKSIHTAGRDAATVVRRLREFYRSREGDEVFRPVSLNSLVAEAIDLTQPRWRDQALAKGVTIDIRTDLAEVPLVSGNESEIREILTNLILNATDAMPHGGTIEFQTRTDGEWIVLVVRDTGSGMTQDVRERCLEPFFSTKGEHGTGLGLSMVYGVVQRHGGTLDIDSEVGRGTTFVIRLAPYRQDTVEESGETVEAPPRPLRVLLVDDDPPALDVLHECLAADHHTVETARNGREGFEKFRRGLFDVVITDRAMPEMSGDQLAQAIKGLRPTTPVVLVSGFGEIIKVSGEVLPDVDAILSKPITIASLRQAIQQCTSGRTPSDPVSA
jgi:signal transduction histidine kinase/ActR/RegA family two-component response regulator/HAMP domain-containing protein